MAVPPAASRLRTERAGRSLLLLILPWLAMLAAPKPAAGLQQAADATADTNVLFPVEYIEQRLRTPIFTITDMERTRHLAEDRSRRVTLAPTDEHPAMEVHWKPVAPPGHGFNNEPRYELAAYRFQKLFLAEPDYVVPPSVLRALPIEEYRRFRPVRSPTVRGTQSVLFLLSYWLQNLAIDTIDPFDAALFERDPVYARHFANANLLAHLIDHKDSNHGNMIISMDGMNRRVFVVDNDVAFSSRLSDRGDRWRHLQVTRIPASTIERLRSLTRAELDHQLGVVAEFEIVDGLLEPAEPGPNLGANSGVRIRNGRMQLGLTRSEIRDVESRIQRLLREVDRQRIRTF
jgi:hypothetical protein